MKLAEIRCQVWTENAWFLARDGGARHDQKDAAVKEMCDVCKRLRGIGYVFFKEDNSTMCYFCHPEREMTEVERWKHLWINQ